ncbi:hypothetical protein [Blastococcus sp. SYSU DS0617]
MGPASRTAVALAVGTVLTSAGCSSSADPGLAAFDRPTSSEDAIPAGVELEQEYDEIRYIGEAADARVYAARGRADRPWCVVVVLAPSAEGDAWAASSSCADDARFAEAGVFSTVRGPAGRQGGAVLLPDDFAGEVRSGWEVVEPNLAVPGDS